MPYQQTMQGLGDMYNLPVGMMPQAMGLLDQQQRADSMTEQDQGRQLAFETANDPLKLQRAGLENQTLEGALGGVQARSRMDVRKDKGQGATYDAEIAAALAKHGAERVAAHAAEAESAGQRLSQLGEDAWANPIGAHDRIKRTLEQEGLGHLWSPKWEDGDVGALGDHLGMYGSKLQEASSKYKSAVDLLKLKTASAEGIAGGHDATALEKARIEAAARLAAKKQSAETMSQYEARIRAAAGAGDQASKDALELLESQQVKKASASAGVAAAGKPNMDAQGVPSNATVAKVDAAAVATGLPKPAIQYLLDNPHLRADFDKKYGAGAAAKILGK